MECNDSNSSLTSLAVIGTAVAPSKHIISSITSSKRPEGSGSARLRAPSTVSLAEQNLHSSAVTCHCSAGHSIVRCNSRLLISMQWQHAADIHHSNPATTADVVERKLQ